MIPKWRFMLLKCLFMIPKCLFTNLKCPITDQFSRKSESEAPLSIC